MQTGVVSRKKAHAVSKSEIYFIFHLQENVNHTCVCVCLYCVSTLYKN